MGYQMRVDPQNIKIKELIESGTIGDIYVYRRRHGLATHTWAGFENTWHADPKLNRDIFADDSSHPIDMLNWIFGVPETVIAELTTVCNPKVKNDNGVALFKYKNGMIAEISTYFTCSAAGNHHRGLRVARRHPAVFRGRAFNPPASRHRGT